MLRAGRNDMEFEISRIHELSIVILIEQIFNKM